MLESRFGSCVIVVSLVWLAFSSLAARGAETPSVQQAAPTPQRSDALHAFVRVKKVDSQSRSGTALPKTGLLLALTRSGVTSLNVFESSSGQLVQIAGSKETGPLSFSRAAGRLAYLVREGPNPARNTIEIIDWQHGNTLTLEPSSGYALLGFALDAVGKRLGYAAMNLAASRSTNVMWHVGIADLERGDTRVAVSSNSQKSPEEGIPVPFAWSSQSALIYLQGWLPFRGMVKQSVWSMNPEGAKLAKVIAAADSVGMPRLSPDGLRLAYLSAELDRLPSDYAPAPGPPPGNLLSVMDAASGAKAAWVHGGAGAFGSFDWSANGEEVLASTQAWANGSFRDTELRRITKSTSLPVVKIPPSQSFKTVTDIIECRGRTLFWVEKDRASAKLYLNREQNGQAVLDLPGGAIQLLGCVN